MTTTLKRNPSLSQKLLRVLTRRESSTTKQLLPPPPGAHESTGTTPRLRPHHGLHVPLPPLLFQTTTQRGTAKVGHRVEDDPFVAAYIECTSSVRKKKRGGCFGFSCKGGLREVREEVRVRVNRACRERTGERRRRERDDKGRKPLIH